MQVALLTFKVSERKIAPEISFYLAPLSAVLTDSRPLQYPSSLRMNLVIIKMLSPVGRHVFVADSNMLIRAFTSVKKFTSDLMQRTVSESIGRMLYYIECVDTF